MLIDKNSLIINGINMAPYLVEVKFGYNKLWSSDSGRNLAGTQSGTLIGVFPKLVLQFGPLTQSQLEVIIPILDSVRQTVTYYDPNKKRSVTMTTYTGDYEFSNKHLLTYDRTNEGFSCSFISVRKRV